MQEYNPTDRARAIGGIAPDPAVAVTGGVGLSLGNELLRRLRPDAAAAIMAAGRRVTVLAGQTISLPGQAADTVHFPVSGLIAGLAVDHDGSAAQVECTGADGALGLVEALAGVPLAFEYRAMVNSEAWAVPAEALRGLVRACPATGETLQRHVARLYEDARRASACAARHALRARLADCLLAYQEKTALARLPLTQETLSSVLGANRTTVTALAIALSDSGLTRTGRGWISVVDAERLERLACGCRKPAPADAVKAAPPALA